MAQPQWTKNNTLAPLIHSICICWTEYLFSDSGLSTDTSTNKDVSENLHDKKKNYVPN